MGAALLDAHAWYGPLVMKWCFIGAVKEIVPMVLLLNCETGTNVRFDGLRGSFLHRCAKPAEHRPAVAKYCDTARQVAVKTERP